MPIYTILPEFDPSAARAQLFEFQPGFATTFGAAFGEGLHMTSVVAIYDFIRTSTLFTADEDVLSEKLWRESVFFRQGLKYRAGMTEDIAEILAERFDTKRERDFILARGGMIPTFAGFMAGGMLDPVNLIPFTAGLRGAKLLSAIGRGARNNAFIEVALQPLLAAQAGAFQEDFTLEMAATNILFAAGMGGAFGALGNVLGRLSPQERAFATQKAVVDMVNDKPVDVGGIIGDKYDAAPLLRAEMDGAEIAFNLPGPDGSMGRTPPPIGAIDTPASLRTPEQQWLMDHLVVDEDTLRAMDIHRKPAETRTPDETTLLDQFKEGPKTPIKKIDALALPEPERIADEPESAAKPGRMEEVDEAEIKLLDEQVRALEPDREADAEPPAEIKAADEAAAADMNRASAIEAAAICLSS